jgi:hypothetical protein
MNVQKQGAARCFHLAASCFLAPLFPWEISFLFGKKVSAEATFMFYDCVDSLLRKKNEIAYMPARPTIAKIILLTIS